jgi:hypothetical protein
LDRDHDGAGRRRLGPAAALRNLCLALR